MPGITPCLRSFWYPISGANWASLKLAWLCPASLAGPLPRYDSSGHIVLYETMPYDQYVEKFVKPHIRRRLDRLRAQYAGQRIVNVDPEKMQSLVAKLSAEDNKTRRKAALALGKSGETWAILPLAEAYYAWQDGDCLAYWQSRDVLFAVGLALLELGEMKELVDCLGDDSGFINPSKWEKFNMQDIGTKRVLKALLSLLTTPAMTPGAEYWAARALGMLGDRGAVASLVERLMHYPASVDFQTAMVDALGALGDPRAIEVLELLVISDCEKKNSWKKTVGECALRALERIEQQTSSDTI